MSDIEKLLRTDAGDMLVMRAEVERLRAFYNEAVTTIERLRAENAEFRVALDKFRIWMKNQDRSPYEQKIYDALSAALEGK